MEPELTEKLKQKEILKSVTVLWGYCHPDWPGFVKIKIFSLKISSEKPKITKVLLKTSNHRNQSWNIFNV